MHSKTALITGVGRTVGIGAAIARALAADGWNLVLNYWQAYDERMPWGIQPDDVGTLTAELEGAGAKVWSLPGDLGDPTAVDRLMNQIAQEAGPLEGMVLSHCESVDSAILDTSVEAFDRHFAVNTRAAWQLIAAFARQATPDGGAIVALTSDHTAFNLPYGASKGALDRIVIAAARELGGQGISANVLNPGPVDTGWMDEATRETMAALQPGGRLGTPEDVAPTAAFLLSPGGRWVSGQLIKSDGGFSS
ncbi:3-oxoacyl-[acyl-carrier protein] reductase [Arthrobacter stackebrandtii]|uniref:3-oxoacyl-[acyl-carrier protein] reductase n=1 Tax=Arthrobacter stackebrandtii TaxID=272161 RepID=A0ABS4YWY5_9MICC|nr:SDR family oxidoreductase [Arthrobacter stackebrandtii]MBP2413219.1 3-oxoacyl-[acyl-carrier protein] reductase [Arthrobacter stackebrandtii]PYH01032.1 short-chain dehydrogenase [Arthrobacter stackebrandtii]